MENYRGENNRNKKELTSFIMRRLQIKYTLKNLFLLACLIVALIFPSQPTYADPPSPFISSCQILDSAGFTYQLFADIGSEGSPVDITGTGYCFSVTADNVTLDLNGFDVIVDATSGANDIIDVSGDGFTLDNSAGSTSNLKQADSSNYKLVRAIEIKGDNATLGNSATNNINIYRFGPNSGGSAYKGVIRFSGSSGNTVQNLTISSSGQDTASSSPRNKGSSNPIISLKSSSATIERNILTGYSGPSGGVVYCEGCTSLPVILNDNTITNDDGFCFSSTRTSSNVSISGRGNTCNGGALVIYDRPSSQTISGLNVAEVYITGGSNTTLENSTISNGLIIANATNLTVQNNDICTKSASVCDGYAKGGVKIFGPNSSGDQNITFSGNEIWGAGGNRYYQEGFAIRGIRGVTVTNNIIKSGGTMGVYFYAPDNPYDITFNGNTIEFTVCTNYGCSSKGAIYMRRGKNVSFTNDTVTSGDNAIAFANVFSTDGVTPDVSFTNVTVTSGVGSSDYVLRDQDSNGPDEIMIINPPTIPSIRFDKVQEDQLPKVQIRRYLNATVLDSYGNAVSGATVACATTAGGSGTCDGYSDQTTNASGQAPQNSLHILDRVIEATGSCPTSTPCSQLTTDYEHTVTATIASSTSGTGPSTLCLTGCDIDHASPTPVDMSLNHDPIVSLDVISLTGTPPNYNVNLDTTVSDPDGNIVSYDWDLDGNGSYETSGGSTAIAIFGGANIAGVKVTDNNGATATDTVNFNLTISSPLNSFYANNSNYQTFTISGTAMPATNVEIWADAVSLGTTVSDVVTGLWTRTLNLSLFINEGDVSLTSTVTSPSPITSGAVNGNYDKTAPAAPTSFQAD